MLGAIAEFERDLINERVREGIEAAKKKAILGTKEKKLIYTQHEKGKSVECLSKFFHVARNTIYRAIKDVQKFNSFWNKLIVSKHCSKSKRL
jgi:DNA invertase Pin-like site-specific DNA recombinase